MCKVRFMKDAGQILHELLSERKASNPSYSLRAFARDIGLSPPQLSNVISGKRGLSEAMVSKVLDRLALDPREQSWFRTSLKAKFCKSSKDRSEAQKKVAVLSADVDTKYLDLDLFKAVSNWYHFALIELIKISTGTKNSVQNFSERLGISEDEINLALGRLIRLELISFTKKAYVVNQDTVIADQGIPSEAVKNFHRQILEKSAQAMAFQNPSERYGYSAALPVKVKSVDRAKKLIQKFRTDFAREISDHEGGEEIYGLCLQFFKLTQTQITKED